MLSRARYLASKFRAAGVIGTLDLLYVSLFRVNVFHVLYLDLKGAASDFRPPEGVVFEQPSLDELRRIRSALPERPLEYYCDETFGYTLPFLARVHDRIAAIMWIVLRGQQSRFLDLQEGDVEINYLAVNPDFRGKRLGQHLMAFQIRWAAEAGNKRMFVVPNAENIPSERSMLDLGFRPVEALRHFSVWRPKALLRHVN